MRTNDLRDGELMPRESYTMRTPEKMAEVIAAIDPFQNTAMTYDAGYRAGLADLRMKIKSLYIWNLTEREPGFEYAQGYRKAFTDYA